MSACRCVVITEPGDESVLRIVEREPREPGPGEVLVRVRAAGLNRADLLQRQGHYPAPPGVPSDIPGLEVAGEIEAIGEEVQAWSVGDRVMAIVAGGGMSELTVVPQGQLMSIPGSMSFPSAAAIPEAFLTAFDAIAMQGAAREGENLLVHAAASGVGTAALQLGHVMGMRPLATTRTEAKSHRLAEYGADEVIVVSDRKFADRVREMTGSGADVILDFVGGAYLEENLRSLATGGRIVAIGLLGGARAEISLGRLLAKRATLVGTVLRSRSKGEKAALVASFQGRFAAAWGSKELCPVINEVMPVEKVGEAHRLLASNETFGKIVLTF